MQREPTHWKRPWCCERLKAGRQRDDRGRDGWMSSRTQWTWVWASSVRWWRTGKPGVLQSMESKRVRHDWMTEQQQMCMHMCAFAKATPAWSTNIRMLLLLSRFSCVWLCATPQMAAHQAPSSLEFSRQEHWSGLPFPSPMHKSEKWKWSRSIVCNSSPPHGLQPTRLLHPWDFPGKSTGVGCHCLLQI